MTINDAYERRMLGRDVAKIISQDDSYGPRRPELWRDTADAVVTLVAEELGVELPRS